MPIPLVCSSCRKVTLVDDGALSATCESCGGLLSMTREAILAGQAAAAGADPTQRDFRCLACGASYPGTRGAPQPTCPKCGHVAGQPLPASARPAAGWSEGGGGGWGRGLMMGVGYAIVLLVIRSVVRGGGPQSRESAALSYVIVTLTALVPLAVIGAIARLAGYRETREDVGGATLGFALGCILLYATC